MAKKSLPKAPLNDLSRDILECLKHEFLQNRRTTDDLLEGYVGMTLTELESRFLNNASITRVDYDLALKALEDRKLVRTGPMVGYDNKPGAAVFILGMFSKREYGYLTEEGYNFVSGSPKRENSSSTSRQTVNISGGSFYQSPIGVGGQVSQALHFDVSNQNDTVNYLVDLLSKDGHSVTPEAKSQIIDMVSKANAGDMASAKPIYQRVFGAVSEPIKEIATAALVAIVTKSISG